MTKFVVVLCALGAFLLFGELSFGPLGAANGPAATVHMKGATFDPADVSVAEGQTVEFVNDDDAPHTVTAGNNAFDSGNLEPGHSWSHTFTKAGTFAYGCTYHSWMHGTVKVLPMAQNVRSSARPALFGAVVFP